MKMLLSESMMSMQDIGVLLTAEERLSPFVKDQPHHLSTPLQPQQYLSKVDVHKHGKNLVQR